MKVIALISVLSITTAVFANVSSDGAFLDAQYKNLVHLKSTRASEASENKSLPVSNTKEMIHNQSAVRSQAARGTCSIFSTTAYLEALLIKKGANSAIDLSEEWLEYAALKNKTTDGSTAWVNFETIVNYGMPSEQSLPYIGEDWTTVFNPLKDLRCGKLSGPSQKSCYIVHRDPSLMDLTDEQIITNFSDKEFVNARSEALSLKKTLKYANYNFDINSKAQLKEVLNQGQPVVLEVDFFYGAWNHSEASEFGIDRNLDHWSKGIITYPEAGSVDAEESPKHPAGHSVLIVGYDDNRVVQKSIKMKNGTMKTFSYKGVYYIKNSWGTSSFGRDFEIDGEKFPGYGMMVQKYAEEKGQFFQMNLL
jgi:hypothetical protein